ncbi:MAG: FAD-binding protein [Eubacterium sp.]|nr:FAD-binding protein [Eubacterium sp.]
MISIKNIKLKPGYKEKDILNAIYRELKLDSFKKKGVSLEKYEILKESLDSRKHDNIFYLLNVGVWLCFNNKSSKLDQAKFVELLHNKNIMLTNPLKYEFPHILNMEVRQFLEDGQEYKPVIVGSGPAGYFAAIKLAKAGFKPIVLERGKPVEEREADIERFWQEGILDPDSNVCFGEGGAGTFSDGKLNTGNKDKGGYFNEVLKTFVEYGGPKEILYKAKPHIGTDVLRKILKNMRLAIEKYGGQVRFQNTLIDVKYEISEISELAINTFGYESELPIYDLSVRKADGSIYSISTHTLILAIGHSARDTYEMLLNRNFQMSPKPFAMGVRVEHLQETINEAMYGKDYKEKYKELPPADYKLVYHTKDQTNELYERSVFSFCMCPGGYVVNSSTEGDSVVVNGMSYSGRDGQNANSAIVVNINPSDWITSDNKNIDDKVYDKVDIIGGLDFQRSIEKKAYIEGKGSIPLQLYGDIRNNRLSTGFGSISPQIKGNFKFGDLRKVFPDYIIESILEAFSYFGSRINGFDNDDTILTAVESRTSSPVRIDREEDMNALHFPGIFPIGEGAGYAGGITSAAADGIKCAHKASEYLVNDLIESFKAFETAKYL